VRDYNEYLISNKGTLMKRFFLEYLESRDDLVLSSSPHLVMKTSFNKGVNVSRHAGHSRKKDALAYMEDINKAAGKVIAVYHGPETV
jgi:hypothetical protein